MSFQANEFAAIRKYIFQLFEGVYAAKTSAGLMSSAFQHICCTLEQWPLYCALERGANDGTRCFLEQNAEVHPVWLMDGAMMAAKCLNSVMNYLNRTFIKHSFTFPHLVTVYNMVLDEFLGKLWVRDLMGEGPGQCAAFRRAARAAVRSADPGAFAGLPEWEQVLFALFCEKMAGAQAQANRLRASCQHPRMDFSFWPGDRPGVAELCRFAGHSIEALRPYTEAALAANPRLQQLRRQLRQAGFESASKWVPRPLAIQLASSAELVALPDPHSADVLERLGAFSARSQQFWFKKRLKLYEQWRRSVVAFVLCWKRARALDAPPTPADSAPPRPPDQLNLGCLDEFVIQKIARMAWDSRNCFLYEWPAVSQIKMTNE